MLYHHEGALARIRRLQNQDKQTPESTSRINVPRLPALLVLDLELPPNGCWDMKCRNAVIEIHTLQSTP